MMRFGPVPLDEALGATLAHSRTLTSGTLRKGLILREKDVQALRDDGLQSVTVARLDPGDLPEDVAATALAEALLGPGFEASVAGAGRVNLKAKGPGIIEVSAEAVQAVNLVDPAISLATLPPFARVATGTLVATVKIIPYAVAETNLRAACAKAQGALRFRPVVLRRASLILTEVPQQKEGLGAKARRAVETRLRALGMGFAWVETVAHDEAALAAAIARAEGDMVLILTGSATSDLCDTAPQALRLAGGQVTRFGLPVDPGNLLFLGDLAGRPVVGLPGCARSVALNGADWVLERLACGLILSDADIAAMGVGGLLKEIPTRPRRREP